jgi:prepilin-type processing-associated H-X9-DG protein
MKTDDDPQGGGRDPDLKWARMAADLRTYREAQRRTWGDFDEAAIARYLADEATEEERGCVEQAMRDFPRVRDCVEILRQVMNEVDFGREDRTESAGEGASRPISQAPSNRAHPRAGAGLDPPVGAPPGGFNLVHALVLTAIAATVLAMLIPAAQSARAAARRAQCVNNLKEIGLAISSYESSQGCFPMGARHASLINPLPPYTACGTYFGHSWSDYIRPFLERVSHFNTFNFERPYNSTSNVTALGVKVPSYVCPADTQATVLGPTFIDPAQASYGAVRGITNNATFNWTTRNPDRCGAIDSEGVFNIDISCRVSSVTDGLSYTMFVGEMSRFLNEPGGSHFNFNAVDGLWRGPPWTSATAYWPGDWRITGGAYTVPRLNAPPDMTGALGNFQGGGLCMQNPFGTTKYSGGNPLGWVTIPQCANLGQFGFRSLHPGGGHFLFGDGSIRFLKTTIDSRTYRALSTKDIGEVINSDAY